MFKIRVAIKLYLLLILHLVPETEQKRNYYIGFSSIKCSHNSSTIIKDFSCSLSAPSGKYNNNFTNSFDAYFIFPEILRTFDMQIILSCHPKNMRHWTVFNERINGCVFLELVHRQTIFRIFTQALKKYVNVKEFKCPLQKNFNYTLSGFKYDEEDFPSYVPEAQFHAVAYLSVQKKNIASANIWGYTKYLKKL